MLLQNDAERATSSSPLPFPRRISTPSTNSSVEKATGLSLRRNVLWTLSANTIYALTQWGMLVALAKLTASEIVGQFGIAYAIGAPVIMFANLYLRQIQATDAREEYLFGHFLALRLSTSAVAFLAITAIALVTGYPWPTKLIIIAVGLAKVLEAWEDIIYGLLQKHERMDRMSISIITKAFLELFIMSLAVFATRGLMAGIIGLMLVRFLLIITYDRHSVQMVIGSSHLTAQHDLPGKETGWEIFRPVWSRSILRRLTWLALPVAIAVSLNSLNANIPRYFISHYLTDQNLGIFVALSYILVGGNMVIMALGLSLSPRLSKYYVQMNRARFRRLVLQGSFIVILLGLAGVAGVRLLGREFLTIVYSSEYANHVKVLSILVLAATLQYLVAFLRQVFTAARYLKVQLFVTVLGTLTLIAACHFLIPQDGLMGASQAVLCASSVMLLISILLTVYILYDHGRGVFPSPEHGGD